MSNNNTAYEKHHSLYLAMNVEWDASKTFFVQGVSYSLFRTLSRDEYNSNQSTLHLTILNNALYDGDDYDYLAVGPLSLDYVPRSTYKSDLACPGTTQVSSHNY